MIDPRYYAGLFDGEGSVSISIQRGTHYYLRCNVANTYKPVLEPLRPVYGGTFKRRQNEVWLWGASGRMAAHFLGDILPYSVIKRDQILLALAFQSRPRTAGRAPSADELIARHAMYAEMRSLKKVRFSE